MMLDAVIIFAKQAYAKENDKTNYIIFKTGNMLSFVLCL